MNLKRNLAKEVSGLLREAEEGSVGLMGKWVAREVERYS